MISKVTFEIKSNVRSWSNQIISFSTKEIKSVLIHIKDTKCEKSVDDLISINCRITDKKIAFSL